MNTPWAIDELEAFLTACRTHSENYDRAGDSAYRSPAIQAQHDEAIARMPVVKRILDRAWPDWKDELPDRVSLSWEYTPLQHVAKQGLSILRRQAELQENLGEAGPTLSANTMHSNVWQAAQGLWNSRHYGEAVSAAAKSVNAMLQTKVGRRDVSESQLVAESFSLDQPKPGAPRLRLLVNDGSDTFKSLHTGVMAFGQGCFKAIRNVIAHEHGDLSDPPESEALEYLASFSALARWIDKAQVER